MAKAVGVNGTLIEAKNTHIQVSQVRILASASVPFRPTTVPNAKFLALIETKRIRVYSLCLGLFSQVKYGVRSPEFI
jgi:hypothetical protein